MRKMTWLIVPAALVLVVGATSWVDVDKVKVSQRPPIVSPFDSETQLFDHSAGGGGMLLGFGPGIQAGADHIVAQQCDVGGFCWPHGSACCPTGPNNITAPIAVGVLVAYSHTGDPAHLASAVLGGDYDLTCFFPNACPNFGSHTPAFLYRVSVASGDGQYSTFAETGFFDRLTAGTYGDATVDPIYYPCDTYGYLNRHKVLRSGSSINLRPWDMQYMPCNAVNQV